MIKVAQLEAAANLAASRQRALRDLAAFTNRERGERVYISANERQRSPRGDLADKIIALLVEDLRAFIAEADEALKEAGVDLSEEPRPDIAVEPPGPPAEGLELYTSRGKPRCFGVTAGGHQCCNGAAEERGECTIHARSRWRAERASEAA